MKFGKVTLVPQHYTPPAELKNYILKYNNPKHLSENILDLLRDKKINELNKKSLEYVKQNYSQEAVLINALDIFKRIDTSA